MKGVNEGQRFLFFEPSDAASAALRRNLYVKLLGGASSFFFWLIISQKGIFSDVVPMRNSSYLWRLTEELLIVFIRLLLFGTILIVGIASFLLALIWLLNILAG